MDFSINFRSVLKKPLGYLVASGMLMGSLNIAQAQVTEQTTRYTYTAQGQIDTIDGPRTDVPDLTDHDYDPSTDFLNRTTYGAGAGADALNLYQEFLSHNDRGDPQLTRDFNGVETTLDYHVRGWLEQSIVVDPSAATQDAITEWHYDAIGQITCTVTPTGARTLYNYNAARYLESVIEGANDCDPTLNTAGKLKTFTFDPAGNVTGEIVYDGLTEASPITYQTSRTFDELSRLMDVFGSDGQHTHFNYDANGFLTEQIDTTDAQGNTRKTAYTPDNLGRVDQMTDAMNHVTDYGYDTQGPLQTVTDARQNTTTYNRDAFGNVDDLTNPDTGFADYQYDAANNLVRVKAPAGSSNTWTTTPSIA